MPFRRSLPSLIVIGGTSWWTLGLPLQPAGVVPRWPKSNLPGLVTLGELQNDEEVIARFRSKGCFHWYTARVIFERTEHGLDVRVVAQSGFLEDVGMIRRSLTDSEIIALDDVLDLYRSLGSQGMCTTVTRIDLVLYRDGHYAGHERVEDLGCVTWLHVVSFSFDSLVSEALDASMW